MPLSAPGINHAKPSGMVKIKSALKNFTDVRQMYRGKVDRSYNVQGEESRNYIIVLRFCSTAVEYEWFILRTCTATDKQEKSDINCS